MRIKFRPRLLPAVAVAAATLLGFKVADLVTNGMGTVAPVAHAQPATPPQPAADGTKPAKAAATPAAPPAASSTTTDPQALSPSEIDVLQQLSQRRATLDQRAGELDQRDVLLQATEKRIDEKIAKLQDLEKSIAGDVQKQSAEDDAHIQSLVKIYEAMKPKDAAQIFEQLEMPVLLRVLKRMKELKTAPILAAMDPAKARAVTTKLAERHDQSDTASGGTKPASAATPKL
jgi:flagellar motility protein MotE (MotC chaperone)